MFGARIMPYLTLFDPRPFSTNTTVHKGKIGLILFLSAFINSYSAVIEASFRSALGEKALVGKYF
jgi:hypothetical protein